VTTPSDAAPLRRLHPLSLLFGIAAAAKALVIPAVTTAIVAPPLLRIPLLALVLLPALVASVVRYLNYGYRLGTHELVVRQGLLSRTERSIPYARIQNIDLVRNPFHRLFDVALVRIETASGGEPEAVIRVLSLAAVEEMRERVFRRDRAAATAEGEADALSPRLLLALAPRELALYGLVSGRGTVLLAAAIGAVFQFGNLEEVLAQRVAEWARAQQLLPAIETLGWPVLTGLGLLAAIGALALLQGLSALWALLTLHGFRLERDGEDLRTHFGLLNRVSATIPRHRIQSLVLRATPIQRWLGRVSLRAETAGAGTGGQVSEAGAERPWIAPLLRVSRLPALLEEVLPEVDLDAVDWQPLPERARRRLAARGLLVTGAAFAGGLWALGPESVLILVAGVPLALLHGVMTLRTTGYALTDRAVLHRTGWIVRRVMMARLAKIQSIGLVASPFDRRHRMATLQVDTAGSGPLSRRFEIRYLDARDAQELADRLHEEAARRTFRW
jgi:putative membrane protein